MSTIRASHNSAGWCRTDSRMSAWSRRSPGEFRHPCERELHSLRKRGMDRGPLAQARVAFVLHSAIRDLLRLRVRGRDPDYLKYSDELPPNIPWPVGKDIFLLVLRLRRPEELTRLLVRDSLIRWRVRARALEFCDRRR